MDRPPREPKYEKDRQNEGNIREIKENGEYLRIVLILPTRSERLAATLPFSIIIAYRLVLKDLDLYFAVKYFFFNNFITETSYRASLLLLP